MAELMNLGIRLPDWYTPLPPNIRERRARSRCSKRCGYTQFRDRIGSMAKLGSDHRRYPRSERYHQSLCVLRLAFCQSGILRRRMLLCQGFVRLPVPDSQAYVEEEIESTRSSPSTPVTSPRRSTSSLTMTPGEKAIADISDVRDGKQVDLSRALLTSVATTNISTLQQGLAKQNIYWSGTAWISSALSQRIEGIQDVDLVGVTERLASFVSLPDAGLVGRSTEEEGTVTAAVTPRFDLNGLTPTMADRPMYDFSGSFSPSQTKC